MDMRTALACKGQHVIDMARDGDGLRIIDRKTESQ